MTTPTRFCPNCGAQVNADERFCANCGTRMPDASPPPASSEPPASSAGMPTQALNQVPPPNPSVPPDPTVFTVPPDATAPPPRKGCPVVLIALLSVAGLCVIMLAAGLFAVTLLGQRVSEVFSEVERELATIQVDPTLMAAIEQAGTPEARPTLDAVATPNPLATPGRSGGAAAVQTSIAATVQAALGDGEALVATAEAEVLFALATQLFRDEFVDNRNQWFTGVFREIERNTIEDGVYKVTWFADGFSYELWQVRDLANFIAEIDCRVVAGGGDASCGLIFGQNQDVGFYEFEVFEDYYRVTAYTSGQEPQTLLEGDPAGIIASGETIRLQMVRRGSELRAAINGVVVGRVNDTTFSTGKVGLSTNSYLEEGGVEIWLDNLTIWELP
jgi:hypothetical protein